MLKKIAVAVVAAGGLIVAVTPAHANGHLSIGVGIGLPVGVYGAPAPAYYGPPAPVVYEAAPYPAAAYPVYGPAPYYGGYYGPRYDAYGPRMVYRGGWNGYHGGYYGHHGWHR